MAHCKKRCISLLLTDVCNLSCKYCYCKSSETHPKNEIDYEFVKTAIDDFYAKEKKIYLRFFGNGEPTLCFDLMKKIVDYCRSLDKNSLFELQTNGYFNEEICKWIGENVNIVWISYDGTPEANAFYRVKHDNTSSNDVVEKNIMYLAKKVDTLGVRSTIGRKNLDHQKEMVDNMERLGVKYLFSDVMFASVEDNEFYEKPISPMEYTKKYLEARKYDNKKNIYYGAFFTINFDEKSKIFCRSCIPMPHLTVDGYVSCCDMGYTGDENNVLIYGKYDKENNRIIYDKDKIKYIQNRTVDNLPECKDCPVKYYCAGGCIGEALNEKGSIYSIKEENCEAIRYLYDNLKDEKIDIPVFHP